MDGSSLKRVSRRLAHRTSPAMVISIVAVFIVLSGTAYAATGGNFIIGKPNTANSVSSLSNSAGTALSLSSKAGTPPLAVNSTTQVQKLNASLLGGSPASSFVQGTGKLATGTLALTGQGQNFLVGTSSPYADIYLVGSCDPGGSPGGDIVLYYNSSQPVSFYFFSQSSNGSGQDVGGNGNFTVLSNGVNGGLVTIQVTTGTRVVTFTAGVYVNSFVVGDPCTYSGQVLWNK